MTTSQINKVEEIQLSEYNSAFSYLARIQNLLYRCAAASISMDCYLWFRTLAALKRELSIKMNDTLKEDYRDRVLKINSLISVMSDEMITKENDRPIIRSELYMELDKLEEDLRMLAANYGLLLKNLDDPTAKFFG